MRHLSEQFNIQRGWRQGDPIAPYLFIRCAKILAILIKQNQDIGGKIINDNEHKIAQYADDTCLILNGSPKSLYCSWYNRLFLKPSSTEDKQLWNKNSLDWLKKNSSEVFHHSRLKLDWGSTSFNLLGIEFSVDLDTISSINSFTKYQKFFSFIEQ